MNGGDLRQFQWCKQIENWTIIKEVIGIYDWHGQHTSNYYLLIPLCVLFDMFNM